jgi:hypothetical protein
VSRSEPFELPPGALGSVVRRPPREALVEFTIAPPEPAVRVVGIPETTAIPPAVMRCLDALACACRDAYGLGVEVEGGGEREAALLALEMLRRYLG